MDNVPQKKRIFCLEQIIKDKNIKIIYLKYFFFNPNIVEFINFSLGIMYFVVIH